LFYSLPIITMNEGNQNDTTFGMKNSVINNTKKSNQL
jgi:hypothetical protein